MYNIRANSTAHITTSPHIFTVLISTFHVTFTVEKRCHSWTIILSAPPANANPHCGSLIRAKIWLFQSGMCAGVSYGSRVILSLTPNYPAHHCCRIDWEAFTTRPWRSSGKWKAGPHYCSGGADGFLAPAQPEKAHMLNHPLKRAQILAEPGAAVTNQEYYCREPSREHLPCPTSIFFKKEKKKLSSWDLPKSKRGWKEAFTETFKNI